MTRSSSRQLLSIIGPTLFVGTLAMFQVGCSRKDDTEAGAPSTTTAAPSDDAQMQAGLDDLYKTVDANAAIDVFPPVIAGARNGTLLFSGNPTRPPSISRQKSTQKFQV
jgi:hypothetical protein